MYITLNLFPEKSLICLAYLEYQICITQAYICDYDNERMTCILYEYNIINPSENQ